MLNYIITLLIINNFFLNQNIEIIHKESEIKEIILLGTAYNDKGGAVLLIDENTYNEKGEVLLKKNTIYTLDEVKEWKKNLYGKKVILKGNLQVIKVKRLTEYSSPGIIRLIKNPKWILAPEDW